ncbi:MAG: exodeoxyribonuclease VII small subunit [Acidimicrobiales bacterium]|nr:exodeoxyribonuclease VII small subunit [Acidimicrobiales bacterium]MCB9392670.1 exodeoxyribonuclease VII small subunit [Acidimicrobiaceae bacterium]
MSTSDRDPEAPIAAGYAAALGELEDILARLERSDVDVDVLATQVQRAAELITFCRDRIGNARLQIEQVVARLDE